MQQFPGELIDLRSNLAANDERFFRRLRADHRLLFPNPAKEVCRLGLSRWCGGRYRVGEPGDFRHGGRSVVTGKRDSCDPSTKDDAGRAPASQLLRRDHSQLPAGRNRLRQLFSQIARPAFDELRTYQAYLLTECKLTPGTVVNRLAALRFFFVKTLKRPQFRDFLPYPRDRRRLPTVLSRVELSRLINAAAPNEVHNAGSG